MRNFKDECLETVSDIDRWIVVIQRSTRTFFPPLAPLHNSLRMHWGWYYYWHLNRYRSCVHGAALFVFIALLMTYGILPQFQSRSLASPVYWTGAGTAERCGGKERVQSWSCPANWSTNSVPASADSVVFNSDSKNDSIIDADFSSGISGLSIIGYTGTIRQERDFTVFGPFNQTSGVFQGSLDSKARLNFKSSFDQRAGTFYAPEGELFIEGTFTPFDEGFVVSKTGQVLIEDFAAWQNFAQKQMAKAEYELSLQEKSSSGEKFKEPKWHFANRANNLRTYIDENGWQMGPRTTDEGTPKWSWRYSFVGLGRDKIRNAPGIDKDKIKNESQRVVLERDNVSEWYENSERGIEQGFTIEKRPDGDNELAVQGKVETDIKVSSSSAEQIVFATNSRDIFKYHELKATDKDGKVLPARMEIELKKKPWWQKKSQTNIFILNLIVDDKNAAYPITVDPLSSIASWTAESDQTGAAFGYSVSTAGDVNNDGYSDIVVG
ncbi:MAG: integrin alpha, partial [Patescibacteria group bacterium]